MKPFWSRVTAASILSLSVYGATQYFAGQYRPVRSMEITDRPIAFIQDVSEEVEKRSVTSLVWKGVSQGEPLHPGEAVKTSAQSEVRIQFTESSRFINLDPESLIVLTQENGRDISLDLLDGSLLVGQKDETIPAGSSERPALTLKSPQGQVDLSEATAQISKSSDKTVDLQILKGKAKVQTEKGVQEIDRTRQFSHLEILSPPLDQTRYLNASSPEAIPFQWKGFPENARVNLWTGKTRSSLKEAAPLASHYENKLSVLLPAGHYFWKLKAVDSESGKVVQESSIFRLKVENLFPPAPILPLHKSRQTQESVFFQWLRPERAQKVLVELARDSALKENLFSKTFTDAESFKETLKPGTYYWRLSAVYPQLSTPVLSPVYSFTIGAEREPTIPVVISWLSPQGGQSQFFIDSPKATLAWSTEQKDQVHSWRLKLAESEESLKENQGQPLYQSQIKETRLETPVPKSGRYMAMVEALDDKDKVLAVSSIQKFEVAPLPLLQAPEFEPLEGDFKTDPQGHLNLRWTQVPQAKEYWLRLLDATGKEIRKAHFERNATALSNLLPGKYQISISAVDEHGRESEQKPPRWVLVPEGNGLQAPKVKKIEVN